MKHSVFIQMALGWLLVTTCGAQQLPSPMDRSELNRIGVATLESSQILRELRTGILNVNYVVVEVLNPKTEILSEGATKAGDKRTQIDSADYRVVSPKGSSAVNPLIPYRASKQVANYFASKGPNTLRYPLEVEAWSEPGFLAVPVSGRNKPTLLFAAALVIPSTMSQDFVDLTVGLTIKQSPVVDMTWCADNNAWKRCVGWSNAVAKKILTPAKAADQWNGAIGLEEMAVCINAILEADETWGGEFVRLRLKHAPLPEELAGIAVGSMAHFSKEPVDTVITAQNIPRNTHKINAQEIPASDAAIESQTRNELLKQLNSLGSYRIMVEIADYRDGLGTLEDTPLRTLLDNALGYAGL